MYALASLAPKMDAKLLQSQVGRILNVARSHTGFRKAHAVSALGKLYQYVDNVDMKEEILDALLLAARDNDENTRRASIFAWEDCISDRTKDRIFNLFEALLEDEAKAVKYGALEALTEVLPYKIGDSAFDRIVGFLKADEPWVRWRVVLAMNKAYPELDAKQREKVTSVLRGLIKDEDIFVKVRAHQALLNIKDVEKRAFPEVDEALKEESDFVRQWVLYSLEPLVGEAGSQG
jgi:HEAT repeat protein